MNRHDLIMSMKEVPKNVNLERIEKIFSEYAEDVKREKKTGWSFVAPYEVNSYQYVNSLADCHRVDTSGKNVGREFISSDLTFDYPQRYFDSEEFKQEEFYFGNNIETRVGENQMGIVGAQPVAA